jgi:hypothetical protein
VHNRGNTRRFFRSAGRCVQVEVADLLGNGGKGEDGSKYDGSKFHGKPMV